MDHGGMNHGGGMDHGGGSGPPAMEHYPGCTMRMLWNADTQSTCIIHPALRIHSGATMLFYMIVLFLCGVGYERLRKAASQNEQRLIASYLDKLGRPVLPSSSNNTVSGPEHTCLPLNEKMLRSALYTLDVAISFILMLVIMTYNAYLIAALLAGAFIGHLLFHADTLSRLDDRGMACH